MDKEKEIAEIRNTEYKTKRPTVDEIEDILYTEIPVLDHGFIRVIDYMGNDGAIVQAARVSYGKGTKQLSQDQGLINYLMRHQHTTPFEMCEIKFHIKLPIFVARQWIRHRTANVNEYSARYSILDREFYIPEKENLSFQSVQNKQCRGNSELSEKEVMKVLNIIKSDAERCYANYMDMMNINEDTGDTIDENREGLARELARMNLNLNFYTQWYWKIDLHNLLHFLRLRSHKHAQFEIRIYAEKMLEIVKKWVPITYNAFMNYAVNSCYLSEAAISIVKRMINGENVTQENSGISKREWGELMEVLKL